MKLFRACLELAVLVLVGYAIFVLWVVLVAQT